jgi:TetR/AcrR family transcriptional regulator, transcriptional repressor for nem operon
MPWPEEHKQATRDRIVDAAAAAMRAKGIDGVSVADIMAEAGLTHGGFYAHFKSKEELLGAALRRASIQTIGILSKDPEIDAVIDTYLSPGHVAHPEIGCPLAAMGSELARAGEKVRQGLAGGVAQRIEFVRRLLPEDQATEENATAMVACMLGGVLLARLVTPEQSDATLEATRSLLHRALQ